MRRFTASPMGSEFVGHVALSARASSLAQTLGSPQNKIWLAPCIRGNRFPKWNRQGNSPSNKCIDALHRNEEAQLARARHPVAADSKMNKTAPAIVHCLGTHPNKSRRGRKSVTE